MMSNGVCAKERSHRWLLALLCSGACAPPDPVIVLAADRLPQDIKVASGHVYWDTHSFYTRSKLKAVGMDGGVARTIIDNDVGGVTVFAIWDGRIYAAIGQLDSVTLDGQERMVVQPSQEWEQTYGLVAGAAGVYWEEAYVLWGIRALGDAPQRLASGVCQPFPVALDDTDLYINADACESNDSGLYRIDLTMGSDSPAVLIAERRVRWVGTSLDDDYVYYADDGGSDGKIMRVPKQAAHPWF
jgi:hypothetical protein